MQRARHGFTLIELSIVLGIVGLLVGGVLAGKSLLRASELRSVTTDYARFAAASNQFLNDYTMLPGDLSRATSYWPTCSVDPITAASCNGNGNTIIDNLESLRFWQHLTLSGMLEGSYSGIVAGDGSSSAQDFLAVGRNVPPSKINKALWAVRDGTSMLLSGNFFILGGIDSDDPGDTQPNEAVVKPEDAVNIDRKLDDGKPTSGTVLARDGIDVGHCLTGSAPNEVYDVGYPDIGCRLMLQLN